MPAKAKPTQPLLLREIERCHLEITRIESEIRAAGHYEMEGLLLGLADWSAELRILESEMD